VQPVEAIRVGHLAARGGGLAPLFTLRRLRRMDISSTLRLVE